MNLSSRNTQEKPNEVPSANFRTVDLATVEDILDIAREEDILERLNPGFLSNILKEIRELREKQKVHKRRNGRRNQKQLRELFLFMTMVAADANKEAFREKLLNRKSKILWTISSKRSAVSPGSRIGSTLESLSPAISMCSIFVKP